jgi:hypothetical protein
LAAPSGKFRARLRGEGIFDLFKHGESLHLFCASIHARVSGLSCIKPTIRIDDLDAVKDFTEVVDS